MLGFAAAQLTIRLPRDRPLWAATLLIGEGDGRAALVLVVHHVLADGTAGLAVLGRLMDGAPSLPAPDFPRPAPSLVRLAVDTAASRVRSVGRLPVMVRRLTSAVIELGPSLRTKAAPCSLNRPTGTHRQVRTVRTDLTPVARLAHQHGATVNDVILTAITGALHLLLAERGEHMPGFVVSIPVSSRPQRRPRRAGQPERCRSRASCPQPVRSMIASRRPPRSPGPPRVTNAERPPRC